VAKRTLFSSRLFNWWVLNTNHGHRKDFGGKNQKRSAVVKTTISYKNLIHTLSEFFVLNSWIVKSFMSLGAYVTDLHRRHFYKSRLLETENGRRIEKKFSYRLGFLLSATG